MANLYREVRQIDAALPLLATNLQEQNKDLMQLLKDWQAWAKDEPTNAAEYELSMLIHEELVERTEALTQPEEAITNA